MFLGAWQEMGYTIVNWALDSGGAAYAANSGGFLTALQAAMSGNGGVIHLQVCLCDRHPPPTLDRAIVSRASVFESEPCLACMTWGLHRDSTVDIV